MRNELQKKIEEQTRYASDYAEPGYRMEEDRLGILFANWNTWKQDEIDEIEQEYEIEWDDEWDICDDCGRAFRISPDSYDWTPSGVWMGEYEDNDLPEGMLCINCLKKDEQMQQTFLQHLADNTKCLKLPIDPEPFGWARAAEDLDSGLYERNTNTDFEAADDQLQQRFPLCSFLWQLESTGQFESSFALWVSGPGIRKHLQEVREIVNSCSRPGSIAEQAKQILRSAS